MGKNTTSTNASTTSANPQAAAAYSSLLGQAQGVAATPYQAYTGELTAPINSEQQTGVSGINAAAGQAQPAINQALGIAGNAANPLTAAQIQQYQNPYTQNVVDATQAQFNRNNQQQQEALTGNTIASGALGGNRAGIAANNLSSQQATAQNPVIAGLYANSYNSGLATAGQQFQQNPLAAAGSIANFGVSGQNAALTGAGAQLGAGTVEQQTQQATDTANQAAYAQQQAYPFQTAQWLAGIDTGVGSALGSSSTGTSTAPAPNQAAQYAGLGLAAASFLARGGRVGYADGGPVQHLGVGGTPWSNAPSWVPTFSGTHSAGLAAGHAPTAQTPTTPAFDYSKIISANNKDPNGLISGPSYGGGNAFTDEYGGSASSPLPGLDASDYGSMARGGGISGARFGYVDGGGVPDGYETMRQVNVGAKTNKGGMTLDPYPDTNDNMFFANGRDEKIIRAKRQLRDGLKGYADGGAPDDDPFGDDNRAIAYDLLRKREGIAAPDSIPGGEPPPSQGVGDAVWNPDEPYRLAGPEAMDAWRKGNPIPPLGTSPAAPSDDDEELPPEITKGTTRPPNGVAGPSDDGTALGYSGPPTTNPAGAYVAPISQPSATPSGGLPNAGILGLSPNARSGLLAAGLGMLASRSSNFGNAVGEGGLHGLAAYSAANEHDQKVADEAAKLSREAQNHAEEMKLRTSAQTETARHNKATEEKEYKPVLKEHTDPNSGETTYLTFDPNTRKLTPVQVPGTDVGKSDKFVSQAAPIEDRRKAPQASPEARDESFYKYMQDKRPPGYADIVRGVADYEIDPNREASLQKGARDRLYRDVKQYDPTYDQTHFQEKTGVIQNFSRGPASQAVNSLNVSVAHLGTLAELGDALNNGNVPLINKLGNAVAVQLGRPAPTNFDAAKEIVGDEVVKAVIGGVNSQADREAIKHLILAQQTPAQLKGVIQTFTSLLGGQLDGQRQRYQAGTGLNNFDQKYLAPATQEALKRNIKGEIDPAISKMVYPSGIPQPSAAAPAGAPAIPPAAERAIGQTYQTPKGPARWTAQGWVQ